MMCANKDKLNDILSRFIDAEYELDCFMKIMNDLEGGYFLNDEHELGDKIHFINKELVDYCQKMHRNMEELDEFIMKYRD